MKIHEYQAKQILASYGILIPRGEVVTTSPQAKEAAGRLGGTVVVKAQIHAGGRGKGGGVKLACSPEEAGRIAGEMLDNPLVTPQTGPEGTVVRKVLVEEGIEIQRELYVGIVLDRKAAMPVMMVSEAGGMEIEEVAAHTPEKILKVAVDPTIRFPAFAGRKLAYGLELEGGLVGQGVDLFADLHRAFQEKDCALAEINPLVITDGHLVALDAKMTFDDNALFRHPEILALRDLQEESPLEVEASQFRLNYIRLDGSVGCMVNGAGLAMATMDLIKLAGGEPANFLDVGGGASAEQIENAFRVLLSDKRIKVVLINIFGGILRCDRLAEGLIQAVGRLQVEVPVVIRMEGTNVELGKQMLKESGLNFLTADTMAEVAARAVHAAKTIQGS
ncbi:MAG: ADP-forming succinate--CoA ligase subunit beta [Candidatus Methylomirabilales bacterium]